MGFIKLGGSPKSEGVVFGATRIEQSEDTAD